MLKIILASAVTLTLVASISGAEARPLCPTGGWWNGYKCVFTVANDPSKVAPRGPRADIPARKHNYVGHVTLLR